MSLINLVATLVEEKGYPTEIITVNKTNFSYEGFVIKTTSGTAPVFSEAMLENMLRDGFSLGEIAEKCINYPNETFSMDNILNRDNILKNVRLCVCNSEWNARIINSNAIPSFTIKGTDITAYYRLFIPEKSASTIISYSILNDAGITEEELFDRAIAHLKRESSIRSMSDVLAESGFDCDNIGPEMLILSNNSGMYGAATLADEATLAAAYEMLGSDTICIIPSSVHELIAIATNDDDISPLIESINDNMVAENERLANHPFFYDGKTLSM